jgi:hypothetical protein
MQARVRQGGPRGTFHPRTAARGNQAMVSPDKSEGYSSFKIENVPPFAEDPRKRTHLHTDLNLGHGLGNLRVRQKLLLAILKHNIQIHRSRRGKFYITYYLEKNVSYLPTLPAANKRQVIGLDPEVKAMITRFDAENGAHRQYKGGQDGSDRVHALVAKSRDSVKKVAQAKKELAKPTAATKKEKFAARRQFQKPRYR